MSRTQKSALMLFTAVFVASMLFTPQLTSAQEETPSTPQFTVTARQNSFDITILNQQFSNPNTPVYYDIRYRYSSNENWVETYAGYQTNEEYTVLSYELNEKGQATTRFGGFVFSGKTVQFQVLRSTYTVVGRSAAPPNNYIYAGSNSSWSGTQTCTFPALPTPTPTPYHPETNPPLITPPPGHTENPYGTPFNEGGSSDSSSTSQALDWVQLVTWTLLSVIIALLLIVIFYLRKRSVVNKP